MRTERRDALLIVALAALGACGGDKATAPEPAQLTGTWIATKDEYVSKTTASRIDLVAAGGTAALVLTEQGRLEFVERPAGGRPDTLRGNWSSSVDMITFTFDTMSGERQYDLDLSAEVLRLTGGDAPHDFGAGMEETKQDLAFTK
jgi:hypothetical protein